MITKAVQIQYITFKPLNGGHPGFLAEDPKNHTNLAVCVWEKGGGVCARQGLPWAMCDGLDNMCRQAMFAGLIPIFKLLLFLFRFLLAGCEALSR
jgi:hypothetical protein